MHINYSALDPHVDAFIQFLEETAVGFDIKVEGLSSSEIKPFHF